MSEALEQLQADLKYVEKYLELDAFLGKLSSSQIPDQFSFMTNNGFDERQFHAMVTAGHEIAKSQIAKQGLQVMTGTLILYIAGRFETYVRESIQVAAREIGNKCKKFDALPKKMKASLLETTASVMKEPRKYGHADGGIKSFINRLSAGFEEISDNNPVNYECISITESNMRPDMLSDICDRIGLNDVWSDISTQAAMKRHFGTRSSEEVKTLAKNQLNKIMDVRNSIAHPAASTTFPASSAVIKDLLYIGALCAVLDEVLDTHVSVVGSAQSN